MFLSDRTCCVCRKEGKSVQIHHIDSNKKNHDIGNLCVLCLECHTETQIKGGFHRKLNAEQIILYRDDWYNFVSAKRRSVNLNRRLYPDDAYLKMITDQAEILREKEEYYFLANLYNRLGNKELSDKYIEKELLKNSDDITIISLRSMQNKQDLIPKEVIERVIQQKTKYKDWSQLARTFVDLKNPVEAIKNYCKSILEDLGKNNIFSAAYYFKEMSELKLYNDLFEKDLSIRINNKDIWWQLRCLDELGWKDEANKMLIENKKEIEKMGDIELLYRLYLALGDKKKLIEYNKIKWKALNSFKKAKVMKK